MYLVNQQSLLCALSRVLNTAKHQVVISESEQKGFRNTVGAVFTVGSLKSIMIYR